MSELYVVATPIGNLNDITYRAVEILKQADYIACEDTRITKRLLERYDISGKLISYHQHSSGLKIDKVIELLKSGKSVALVTDAGTPGISDPGGLLVAAAYESEIKVTSVPGPSALTAALSISGMPTDKFVFLGFLPHKKGRQTALKKIAESELTVVLYESVHRIQKFLKEMLEFEINREIVVCREITKKFETIYRGKPSEVLAKLNSDEIKGEFVVIINGKN